MTQLSTFYYFLRRDLKASAGQLRDSFINYILISPVVYGIAFGYIQPNVLLKNGGPKMATISFAGVILLQMLILSYKRNISLLFDFEGTRFIDYQLTVLSPRLILLEKLVFNSVFTFLMLAPYFPMSKLVVGATLDTSTTNWPLTLLMVFLGSVCCNAYHLFATLMLPNTRKITMLWARVNMPLFIFGGLFVPLHVLYAFWPWLGRATLLNPLMYVTEGLRQALVGGPDFLSLPICISVLVAFTIIFMYGAMYQFKQRVDHI